MKTPNLETMLTDQLWEFHAQVERLLVKKMTAEKRDLELKLGKLRSDMAPPSSATAAALLPRGAPKIPESRRSLTDLGRSRQDTAVGEQDGGNGQKRRRLANSLKGMR